MALPRWRPRTRSEIRRPSVGYRDEPDRCGAQRHRLHDPWRGDARALCMARRPRRRRLPQPERLELIGRDHGSVRRLCPVERGNELRWSERLGRIASSARLDQRRRGRVGDDRTGVLAGVRSGVVRSGGLDALQVAESDQRIAGRCRREQGGEEEAMAQPTRTTRLQVSRHAPELYHRATARPPAR